MRSWSRSVFPLCFKTFKTFNTCMFWKSWFMTEWSNIAKKKSVWGQAQFSYCHANTRRHPNPHFPEHTAAHKHGHYGLHSPAQQSIVTFTLTRILIMYTSPIPHHPHNVYKHRLSQQLFVKWCSVCLDLTYQVLHSCHNILALIFSTVYYFKDRNISLKFYFYNPNLKKSWDIM